MSQMTLFWPNIWYHYRYGSHDLICIGQKSALANNSSIQTNIGKTFKSLGWTGIWNFWPCIINGLNGMAFMTPARRGLKCYYVSLLPVLLFLLVWALFSLWWGACHQELQVHSNKRHWFNYKVNAHHWINHYDQKKLVLLLVHLIWTGNPRDQSKECEWSPTPRGGSPKEGRKLSVEGVCCGHPKIPLGCQLQNPASIV